MITPIRCPVHAAAATQTRHNLIVPTLLRFVDPIFIGQKRPAQNDEICIPFFKHGSSFLRRHDRADKRHGNRKGLLHRTGQLTVDRVRLQCRGGHMNVAPLVHIQSRRDIHHIQIRLSLFQKRQNFIQLHAVRYPFLRADPQIHRIVRPHSFTHGFHNG